MRSGKAMLLGCVALIGACAAPDEEVETDPGLAIGKADESAGPVRVSEVLRGGGAFVELRNGDDAPVELDGWWVSFGRRRVKLHALDGQAHVVAPGGLALITDVARDDVPVGTPMVATAAPLDSLLASPRLVVRSPARAVADRADASAPVPAGVALERRSDGQFQPSALGATPGQRNTLGGDALVARFSGPGAVDALAAPLAALVDEARRTVDAALYQLDHPLVLDALERAATRGVRVRLATDTRYYTDPDYQPGYRRLEAAGVQIVDDQRTARMHDKLVVVDGAVVWTGSYNPVKPDGKAVHADNALTLRSPALAALHTAEMDLLMARRFGPAKDEPPATDVFVDGARVELAFAPGEGPRARILAAIAGARTSISFCVFALAMPEVGEALVAAHARGVDVRGVFDDTSAVGNGSTYPALIAAGIDVRRPVSSLFLHDKLFVIDYAGDDPRVITGSYNFSGKADRANDEALYVVHDRAVAAAYYRTFRALYDGAAGANTDTTGLPSLAVTRVATSEATAAPFVELANLGDATVDLSTLRIVDRRGATVTAPTGLLDAGARVRIARRIDARDALVVRDTVGRVVATFDAPAFAGVAFALERVDLTAPDPIATFQPAPIE